MRDDQRDLLGSSWRQEFPALAQEIGGYPLAYLDSAATTHRPRVVIDTIARFYERDNANPGPALHTLARRAAEQYGAARATVARFLGATSSAEVIFTKGTTEAINLVATTWGAACVARGDEIVLTVAEHYSNLLPWRALAERVGANIRIVDVDDAGRLLPSSVSDALTPRTKLLAFSHVSNVLGLVNPAEEICAMAKARGVTVLVDAAQSAPHVRLDVQALGCDFLACSGHKMLGPMGIGVLWARQATLDAMPPYQLGSNMAHDVDASSAVVCERGALKYQAGTPNVTGAVGLAAAIDALERFDIDAIRRHDAVLVAYARKRLSAVPGLQMVGTLEGEARLPVFTFALRGVPASRLVQSLDRRGVAVRAGDMAALPLLRRFGLSEAVRASCYLYTITEEIDRLADALLHETRGA